AAGDPRRGPGVAPLRHPHRPVRGPRARAARRRHRRALLLPRARTPPARDGPARRRRGAAGHRRRGPQASRHPHQRRDHPRAGARGRRCDRQMRVWVDLTNSPHVLILRPVVERLRAAGHDVRVTARDFAQTVELAERHGMDAEVIGRHRGDRLGAKGIGLASRSFALARWACGRRFDLAFGHGSNDVTVAAWLLRIPCATMFDYEWAAVQHTVNCRLAQAVVVPDAIPADRLARYGARGKIRAYPGLK